MDHSTPTAWRSSLLMAAGATVGLMACNQYELFRVAGFEQVAFSNQVDILFVIDNSSSMDDEAADLVANFDIFIETLASSEGANPETETLSDAVSNYLIWTRDRGRIMDYRIAITTPTIDPVGVGWTDGVEGGEAGTFVRDSVLSKGDSNIVHTFRENLACWSTCWNEEENLPSDPTYTGTSGNCPLPDVGVTIEYLDCLCTDVGYPDPRYTWTSNSLCGSGSEMPMEAAVLALCRAVEDPPEACWDNLPTAIDRDDAIGSNLGFLREGTPTFVVIVTDEGDSSARYGTGNNEATPFIDLFETMGLDVKVVVVGPPYICEEEITDLGNVTETCTLKCNSGGGVLGEIKRLISATELSEGEYYYISEAAGTCTNDVDDDGDGDIDEDDDDCFDGEGNKVGDFECLPSDFEGQLQQLGKLLINLQNAFELQTIPDESTIQVYVDDTQIAKATETNNGQFTGGWSYDPAQNAVVFWGEDIPDYNADVRIFYRPLEGKPRDLPF